MPLTTRAAAKANAERTQRNCEKCKISHNVAEMVACDQCHCWYHRTCAEVAESFSGKWTCQECLLLATISGTSISGRTNSTMRSTRVQLQLMRLEEEKKAQEAALAAKAALEKKYLDDKYALLIAEAEDVEAGSQRSRRSRKSRSSHVQEWVQNVDAAAGGNPCPANVDDIFPPISIGTEMPFRGTATKYTGAVPKTFSSQVTGGGQRIIPEIVPTEGMISTVGEKDPITASTPIRLDEVVRSATPQAQQQQTLFIQPVRTQPIYTESSFAASIPAQPALPKLVPRPPLPTFLFPEPISIFKRSRALESVVLPPVSEQSLLQSRISRPIPSSVEQPARSSIDQPPLVRRVMVSTPPQLPVVTQPASERQTLMQLPTTTQSSSQQQHTISHPPRPLLHDQSERTSQLPFVHQGSVPHPPPPSLSSQRDREVPIPNRQHVSPEQPVETNATQLQQWQNQQAMWGQFQQQLSARQVVPKELPVFTGSPEEWPLFVSSYCNSTTMCGYTQSENLMRLQRCLKGKALEAVRSNLLLPSSVPKVMETLETLFGSPERLVQSLLNKVRSVPTPKAEKLETLVNFGLVVQNLVGHLKAANQLAHLSNPTLLAELVDKLPPHLRLDWALYKKKVGIVDLGTFCDYMSAITSAASDVAHFSDFDVGRSGGGEKQRKERAIINAHVSSESRKYETQGKRTVNQERPCYICHSVQHRIKDCGKFKSLSLGDRWKAVETHQLCAVCLVPHGKWSCKSTRTCGIGDCSKKHHPSLHSSQLKVNIATSPETSRAQPKSDAVLNIHSQIQTATIFRIIPVILYGKGAQIATYAFLDEGSSSTLIEQDLADSLSLGGELQPLCLTWTAKVSRHEADSRLVNLKISGIGSSRTFPLTGVSTVRQLDLPVQSLQYEEMCQLHPYLAGLPVESYENAIPRILIGLDNIKLSLPLKIREANGPIAAKTRLGWTVFGNMNGTKSVSPLLHICKKIEDSDLHDLVKGYFAMENLGVAVACGPEAETDRRAKEILRRTTVKRADGHYETGLLWRNDVVELPSSYDMAERRLVCLERKLKKYPELRASLDKQICEYQSKGYAHKATTQELEESDPHRTWYLPLGVVTNPRKPGKVRIIWDAAAKAKGVSLNDMLLKGPDLLTSLPGVLCRFRQRQVAIAGDIREMYHQLKIREEDRQVQRFLYRTNPSMKPNIFVMDSAIFGSTCSPCSANYVKNTNAMEWKQTFPEAATAIVENHYVDDYLDSRDTEEEMAKLAETVRDVQASAGFELRNWRSNSEKVLQILGKGAADPRKDFNVDKESHIERVLGMAWLPDEDVFVYSVKLPNEHDNLTSTKPLTTKRSILRFVMSVFDPLGLISNLLIHGKMIIQDLWRAQVGWDDGVPPAVLEYWERWIEQISDLSRIRVPRCYFPGYDQDSYRSLQLHIFVDASELAFASVAYFRVIDKGQPRCALIASKAKVAPLRPLSVPRLELQAAVIGGRLAKSIGEYHDIPISSRFLWSDSKTVLSWINSDARKYRQYVAVRIGEILDETQPEEWYWVPTKLNVADEATKWGKGPTIQQNSRWFTGPDFLYRAENEWPKHRIPTSGTEEELRAVLTHHGIGSPPCIDYGRFSRWERMLRCAAYVFAFIERCLKAGIRKSDRGLQQEDLVRAERALWRLAQAEAYAEEIAVLQSLKRKGGKQLLQLDKNSPIRKLSPFLDEFGVVRMEGRTGAAPMATYDAKFPIILPKCHRVTELLIDWYHRRFGHQNSETVVNEIRQRFHISNLRVLVRKVARKCQWCIVRKALPQVPRMAPLPEARVTPFVRPFSLVGIDYFGPYTIKIGRSHVKRWVALFTCLVVRAVHLEAAASLSTESCKLALRRFIARRGAPTQIYTDHGTNFVGASRELAVQMAEINQQLAETFTDTNTRWFFIPPSSPHMGGAWERMVRSVKIAMESINSCRTPSEEVFQTVLCDAESMVNSRPLTYVPIETSDQEALTPNHFILLNSNGVKQPEKTPTTSGEALRNGWNLCRHVLDQFWTRWSREYLPDLTRRTKWHEEVKPIKEGDIVFVVCETMRNQWPRGKVIKTIPGKDGRIRQVDVQTGTGVLRRPVAKVAVLDVLPVGNPAGSTQNYEEGNVAGGVTTANHASTGDELSTGNVSM